MLTKCLLNIAAKRAADLVVLKKGDIYLCRWYVIPRNKLLNIYLHYFLSSDDDRALHDHPWANASYLLKGSYIEHTIAQGGIHKRTKRKAGDFVLRASGKQAHRIELHNGPVWTLFITGPTYRVWGFHCPTNGWVPFFRFLAHDKQGDVGKGCNQ